MMPNHSILLVFATHTGNAEEVADQVQERLSEAGHHIETMDLAFSEDIHAFQNASWILGVVSTWGDGDPPSDAEPFFERLCQSSSLELPKTPFSVLGLGDRSYDQFCECAKTLERELIRHGGVPLVGRVDCDVWFDDDVEQWTENLLLALAQSPTGPPNNPVVS